MRGVSSEKHALLDAAVAEADVDASPVEAIEFDVNSDESVTQVFLCVHLGGLVMDAVVAICEVSLLRETDVAQQCISFLVRLSSVRVCMLVESKFENRLHGSCVSTVLIVLVFVFF